MMIIEFYIFLLIDAEIFTFGLRIKTREEFKLRHD